MNMMARRLSLLRHVQVVKLFRCCCRASVRPFSSSTSLGSFDHHSSSRIPFYGRPRTESSSQQRSKLGLLLKNAVTAFRDPTRGDAVAAVGELTGTMALQRLLQAMKDDPEGRIILAERPIVSKNTIHFDEIIESAKNVDNKAEGVTLGQAYGAFLNQHGFDPDERSQVKYIEDEELAYVILRYRQCHDYWHTLTGLPPTVVGELGLKWLELFQTGLPLAAFSATVGSLGLRYHEQQVLCNIYLPWAKRCALSMKFGAIIMVYYEKEFQTPLAELRRRLGITAAPLNVEGH